MTSSFTSLLYGLGTPSTTGLWALQFGGHHYTFANTYKGGKITGVTPSFRGVEPMAAVTANNRTYQPVEQERQAFASMLVGLSSSEQATAKLSATFTDILLGPGQDGKFPASKSGLKVGDLDAAKKALMLCAIKLYVNDLDSETAALFLAGYTTELDNTYIAYSGTGTMSPQNDYVRIDGPSVWIEYSSQGGIVIRNTRTRTRFGATTPVITVATNVNVFFVKQLLLSISGPAGWLMVFLLSSVATFLPVAATAHPMPNSVVLLSIHANRIDVEVQIPLSELQAAFGHAVNDSSVGAERGPLLARLGPQLRAYLTQHIRPQSPDGRSWTVSVGALVVHETQNPINGVYRELTAHVRLFPPAGEDVRQFTLHYDVVLHQVVTHKILVSVRQDWARGKLTDEQPVQVGLIELDIVNNRIPPLVVSLESGSSWTGFRSMIKLGMQHIAEGTDHLLFLLVLLLPAPLLVNGRRWDSFGGIRYSLIHLLEIVTAFTIGHSITLLAGSLGWVRLPSQAVEILIAVSILVSAGHALRPLFPGREAWVAAGFGLIHGLAFASTLANLQLDAGPMALSILGFNLGIELMQLVVIGLTIPWLILLSRTPVYRYVRTLGAFLASVAAVAWVIERVTDQSNILTKSVEQLTRYAPYALVLLALLALFFTRRMKQANL